MKTKIRKPRLINAKKMSEKYPESFDYWKEDIDKLKEGNLVKVCDGAERFWVKLTKVDGSLLEGSVDNYLIGNLETGKMPPYNYGDIISFNKDHVYQVME